jgi:proton-translocating NADH-quinone oxidoreductase chain N
MMVQFAGSILCLLLDLGKKFYGRMRTYLVGAVCIGSVTFSLVTLILNWFGVEQATGTIQPTQFGLATVYTLDKFGVFVIFTVLVIGLFVSLYSLKYLSAEDNAGPFFSLLLLLLTSIIGVIAGGDFLTLFLFWEGMSICAYGLVAFYKETPICLEAALKYLFLAGTGTLIALYGISLVYSLIGSIQLKDIAILLKTQPQIGTLALMSIVVGFGVEAAIFPLHTWLPDAYSVAPAPISAILSGAVTGTGVFTLLRVVQPLVTAGLQLQTFQNILVVFAFLTMLVGNLGAFAQNNIKRLLAFSSIAHIGYMLSGLSTLSISGLVAVVFHIWNHGIVKSSLFMLTGNKSKSYQDLELENIRGYGQHNKAIGVMFSASSLAMVGSPPFGMFWSELLIIQSLLSIPSTVFIILALTMVLNIFLSIGYYFKIINIVVLESPHEYSSGVQWLMVVTPLALLIISLLTGIFPFIFLSKLA